MRFLSIFLGFVSVAVVLAGDPPSGPLRERIDLNRATKEKLETLPGIGPKMAELIIAGRPYKTINELDRVKGIGPKKLEQLLPLVSVGPQTLAASVARQAPNTSTNQTGRININTASQADLEKLAGIGPKRAEAIMKARPFRKPEDLMRVPGLKKAQFDKIKGQISVR